MCTELMIMRRSVLRPRIDGWTVRTAPSPAGERKKPLRGGRSAWKGTHEAPRVPFKQPSLPHSATGRNGDRFYERMKIKLDNGLLIDGLKALALPGRGCSFHWSGGWPGADATGPFCGGGGGGRGW